MYNFKKNVKLYIVENGNKHSIEVYSDVSASQTFDEQSNKLKTLHDLNALHESASITKANVADFNFTTPIHNTTVTPIVLTLGTTYSSGTVSFFDIYIESDNAIYKLEKAVIESMTFNIERNAISPNDSERELSRNFDTLQMAEAITVAQVALHKHIHLTYCPCRKIYFLTKKT